MKNIILVIVILLVVVGGYFIFRNIYQSSVSKEPFSGEEISGQEELAGEEAGGEELAEVREISVSGNEFSFSPSSIQVQAGEMVKVIFTNVGSAPHDFRIEELGIGTKVIRPGETDTIEFQAPNSGQYTFFCSVAGHREAGMEGNLEVE